jgi:hypothetical protein
MAWLVLLDTYAFQALAALRHGSHLPEKAIREGRGGAAQDPGVGDGCAAAVLALVRFNKDVFVGPVLMGPHRRRTGGSRGVRLARAGVGARRAGGHHPQPARRRAPRARQAPAARRAALRAAQPRVHALALQLTLQLGYYGRREVVDALLAEGLVKRLLCRQRPNLGGSLANMDLSPREKPDGTTPYLIRET